MKVLYLSSAQWHDYLCDMTFHGLRSLLGPDCVDVNPLEFMYSDTIHGGYTVYGLLPNIPVDRDDIPAKIASRYFDIVVYGSIRRYDPYWNEVTNSYPQSRIFMIDGEDNFDLASNYGNGLYFKRELPNDEAYAKMLPISFSIPREKIVAEVPPKSRLMAALDPADRSTYGYVTEESYRDMYACARFGKTMKKAGWDCLRHYEILMMGCVPYFLNLEACPSRTLAWLPKSKLIDARNILDTWPARESEWPELANWMLSYSREHLTTTAAAERLLGNIR